MSIKLTETQLVLLGAAAQRKDLCLVAPSTLKGATAQKVASKLISAGFVKEVKAKAIWRRDDESRASYALKLTATGAEAIAVDEAAEPEDAGGESDALANRDQAAILSKLDATDARPTEAMEPGPARPSAPRSGSKLTRVIALLERDRGATIEELIAATGWLATRPAPRWPACASAAMQSRSIDQTTSGDRSTASRPVRRALLKGRRTPRRRAGRSRAGRIRKPIKRPNGWAPTTARRGRRSVSPDATIRGRPSPRRHDRGAGRARRERTLPAMAQSLGRDPSRPFATLAARENPGPSHPDHRVRRARQRDAARPAPTEGSEARIIGLASFRSADCDNAGRDQAEGRGSACPRMERQARACDDPR
jgi:Protein of unknown function (DUF3489)